MSNYIIINGKKYREVCLHTEAQLPTDRCFREIEPEPMPPLLPGYGIYLDECFVRAGWYGVRMVRGDGVAYWKEDGADSCHRSHIRMVRDMSGDLIWSSNQ